MTQDNKAFCQVQTDNVVLNQEAQGESFTTSGYLNHGKMEEGKKHTSSVMWQRDSIEMGEDQRRTWK